MIRQSYKNNLSKFELLKNKLKVVISECNEKTLKRVDTDDINNQIPMKYYFSGATRGEQHIFENGLCVYIFYNNDTPIDYLFSSKPFFENYEWIHPHFGDKHIGKQYKNVTGFEYTFGGRGYSMPFEYINFYYGEQIGIIGPIQRNRFKVLEKYLDIIPNLEGKLFFLNSTTGYVEKGSFVHSENSDELKQFQDNCDLEGYVENCKPKESYGLSQIDELKSCLSMINELYMKKIQSLDSKKELHELLNLDKELDEKLSKINAFSPKL